MNKLLIATDNLPPKIDGISSFLKEVVPGLQKNFEVTIIGPDYGEDEFHPCKIIKFPLNRTLTFGDFVFAKPNTTVMTEYVKQSDVVFVQSLGPIGSKAVKIASKNHKPVALYMHVVETEVIPKAVKGLIIKYVSRFVKNFTKKMYNKCTLLMVPAQSFVEVLNWRQIYTKRAIVHLGTDTERFTPPENKRQAKKNLNLDPDDIIIGYHGRITREKDLITLFRAFIRLQRKHPNIKLLMVGKGLKELTDILGKRHGVIIVPAQEDVVPFLQAMDIYVLPSLTETTSLSTLEAMSCELPVIATRVGFVKDYLINGINGFLFSKRQVYELVKHLDELISHPVLRMQIGKEARKTVQKRFRWKDTITKIEALLTDLVTHHTSHKK